MRFTKTKYTDYNLVEVNMKKVNLGKNNKVL